MINKLRRYIHAKRNAPAEVLSSDQFIVEFPKSGITWLQTILANLFLLRDQYCRAPTLYNLEQIFMDVHKCRKMRVPQTYPFHRIIKSHDFYNSNYRNVIYLVRNPFSVMESYYKYCTGEGLFEGSVDEFIRNKKYGIDNWVSHVHSWIQPRWQYNMHLIRFEDLKEQGEGTIQGLVRNLGYSFDETEIRRALELSDFSNMKKDDENFQTTSIIRKYNFVRTGDARDNLEPDSRNYIKSKSNDVLHKIYYDKKY